MDFGFYIDAKGRTVTECKCGSYVVFVPESEAISRLCFRCGNNVERPILEHKKDMGDIYAENHWKDTNPLDELNSDERDMDIILNTDLDDETKFDEADE